MDVPSRSNLDQSLATAIPNARLEWIEGARTLSMEEGDPWAFCCVLGSIDPLMQQNSGRAALVAAVFGLPRADQERMLRGGRSTEPVNASGLSTLAGSPPASRVWTSRASEWKTCSFQRDVRPTACGVQITRGSA